jgi:hypothetical protein
MYLGASAVTGSFGAWRDAIGKVEALYGVREHPEGNAAQITLAFWL